MGEVDIEMAEGQLVVRFFVHGSDAQSRIQTGRGTNDTHFALHRRVENKITIDSNEITKKFPFVDGTPPDR